MYCAWQDLHVPMAEVDIYCANMQKLIYTVPIYTVIKFVGSLCILFKLMLDYYVCSRGKKKDKFHVVKERNMVDGYIRNSIRLTRLL